MGRNRNEELDKRTLRIGTFNVLNLVLPEVNYYGSRRYSKSDYEMKKMWLRQQLTNMNADIIGFQEIFHEEALKEVILEHPDYKNAHIVVAAPDRDGPSVAFVSKYPITDYEVISTFSEKIQVKGMEVPFETFSRPILKARIQLSEKQHIIAYVAHLKSKRPLMPEDRDHDFDREDPVELAKGHARALLLRAAEAGAFRTILMETLQQRNHPVVVMGDLNDTHTSVTTQIISGDSPWRYLPMHKKRKYWDVLLYHVKDIQARQSFHDNYYTHIHNGHYESLDHIMVSQELVREYPDHIGRVVSVRTFNDHLVDETLTHEGIPCWKSDHGQVVAQIEMHNELTAKL